MPASPLSEAVTFCGICPAWGHGRDAGQSAPARVFRGSFSPPKPKPGGDIETTIFALPMLRGSGRYNRLGCIIKTNTKHKLTSHLCVLARILPSTAPVRSARSALRPVAREAITPIHAPALGRAARGICRLERRREQELLQLAKCPFGKLARPALAHTKYKQLVSVRAQLAIQAAFEKEDVVVRVAIWSTVDVVRQPSAARAQPPTARIKRPRSRSKHKAGLALPW